MLGVCIAHSLSCYVEFVPISNVPPPDRPHLTIGTEKVLVTLYCLGETHIFKVEHVLHQPLGG